MVSKKDIDELKEAISDEEDDAVKKIKRKLLKSDKVQNYLIYLG
jgi:hypothetical protein